MERTGPGHLHTASVYGYGDQLHPIDKNSALRTSLNTRHSPHIILIYMFKGDVKAVLLLFQKVFLLIVTNPSKNIINKCI
jgi:hypothetical protein